MDSTGWEVRTWARTHAQHGSFFVGVLADGRATAARVFGHREVEDLLPAGPAENVARAMIVCEERVDELDAQASAPHALERVA